MFPRNTSLSNCVLYERLNHGCLNVDDGQVMICDITLYCTSCGGVIGNMPDRILGDLG